MKIRMLLAGLGLLFSGYAMGYGDAGCGLGSLVMTKNTVVSQTLAVTTNGTSANQVFGITSGTSGCKRKGFVRQEKEQEHFIAANFNNLKEDIARGSGENLTALGYLLGCPPEKQPAFRQVLQQNFGAIVPESATPEQVLGNVKETVRADGNLGGACRRA